MHRVVLCAWHDNVGLVGLYHVTGDKKYFDLFKFFLHKRGHHHNTQDCEGSTSSAMCNNRPCRQDHRPVLEQDEVVGHAVRTSYMYAGMADVAALTGRMMRFLPSFSGYIYATRGDALYVNSFVVSRAELELAGRKIPLRQQTRSREGDVEVTLEPETVSKFTVAEPIFVRAHQHERHGRKKPL